MEMTPEPAKSRLRLFWLVAGHVVIGWLAVLMEYSDYGTIWQSEFFGGIVFSQISLLGIWGGLGGTVLWQRLIGVLLGVGYLMCIVGLPLGDFDAAILVLVVVVDGTVSMMVVMLIVRFITGPIRQERSPVVAASRHQFSIRQLLILMFVIACLTAIGKLVQPLVDAFGGDGAFVVLILSAIVYDVIGIIPVWFVLATKRPVLYGICVVAVEACLAYCLGRIADPRSDTDVSGMTFVATEAMSVAVSLLVVRSCGYRLMRMPPRQPFVPASTSEL